jgi:hypothetical protein
MGEIRFDFETEGTNELETDLRRAAKAMEDTSRATRELTEQLKEAAAAKRRTAEEAEKAGAKLDSFKKVAAGLGLQGPVGDVEDLAVGLKGLGPVAVVAAASLAVLAAEGIAIYKLGKYAVDSTLQLEAMHDELVAFQGLPVFDPIPAESVRAAQDARFALDGVSLVLTEISAEAGTVAAPAVRELAVVTLQFALAAEED